MRMVDETEGTTRKIDFLPMSPGWVAWVAGSRTILSCRQFFALVFHGLNFPGRSSSPWVGQSATLRRKAYISTLSKIMHHAERNYPFFLGRKRMLILVETRVTLFRLAADESNARTYCGLAVKSIKLNEKGFNFFNALALERLGDLFERF